MTLEEILGQQGVLGQAMNMEADTSGMTQQQIDEGIAKSRHDLFSQLGAMPVGAVEGIVGLPGDVERLGRGAFGAATADNGNRWNTFLNELGNSDTTLPNTESIQNWTDKQLDGTAFGDMLKAGGDGRLIGEVLAPLPPIAGAVKYGSKGLDFLDDGVTAANKVLNRLDIQPGLSIKSVDNLQDAHVQTKIMDGPSEGYIYNILDTKKGKNYVGSKLGAIDKTEDYLGSGTIIKRIANKRPDDLYKTILGKTSTRRELMTQEEAWLKAMRAAQDGNMYNLKDSYYGSLGLKATDKTKKKLSNMRKGVIKSDEHKRKIGLGNKGRVTTEETKEKLRQANLGKTSPNKGKKMSKEQKKKLSIAGKGRPAWNKGKVISEETKRKISESQRMRLKNDPSINQRPHTEETKRKISESQKKRLKGLL